MTINEKAKKLELPVEKVVELALAAGIDAGDKDRKLNQAEAVKLGISVNQYVKAIGSDEGETSDEPVIEQKNVRFWTEATKHMVQAGDKRIDFKSNILVLDIEDDKDLIKMIRGLRNIAGRYSIYEVLDKPFDEDSEESVWFSNMLEDIIFTGHNRERSKAGIKKVRVMFAPEELAAMGENGFDPRRLVMKALRNKSLKLVSNNV